MVSSQYTVQEKLEQAQTEAEETHKRGESKERRKSAVRSVNNRLGGSRRRSTLSPEELENLMGIV